MDHQELNSRPWVSIRNVVIITTSPKWLQCPLFVVQGIMQTTVNGTGKILRKTLDSRSEDYINIFHQGFGGAVITGLP